MKGSTRQVTFALVTELDNLSNKFLSLITKTSLE